MMIKMGDFQKLNGVGLEDFILLMKELGLIASDKKSNDQKRFQAEEDALIAQDAAN